MLYNGSPQTIVWANCGNAWQTVEHVFTKMNTKPDKRQQISIKIVKDTHHVSALQQPAVMGQKFDNSLHVILLTRFENIGHYKDAIWMEEWRVEKSKRVKG